MKIFFIALLLFPCLCNAQLNRSAIQLANENVQAYLSNNVFKSRVFKQISPSILKAYGVKESETEWTLDQQVEVTENRKASDTSYSEIKQLYSFRFYLDRKLSVQRSDCHFDVKD